LKIESTNIATMTMDKLTHILKSVDARLKDMGTDEYGMVEATKAEKARIKQTMLEQEV